MSMKFKDTIDGSIAKNSATATKLETARTLTIGSKGKTFDGSDNVSWTLDEIGAAASSHNHDSRYYTESEINTKVSALQSEIDADVKVEADRAKAAENTLQANIDKKANASHGNHVPTTQTANNAKFLRNDNTWQTVTPGNIGAYTKTEIDSKVTTINNAISGKADSSHGNHVPATQTANNAKFLRNDNTWQTVTPDNIGAAKSSHGTHVTYSTTTPKAAGTAAVGSEGAVARGDHVHPLQTSVSGNAGTATKLETKRTINGTNFDGSANITTANWGTSRKINQISVNGSADVKIPLDYYTCNITASNSKPYHHILTTGRCTDSYIDKAITIVITQHYNGGGLGIARAVLRTNDTAKGDTATGELKWLVRLGFNENQLCYNLRNTAKDAYMDIFFKCNGTYGSVTWYVLTEGARGSHGSQWTKQSTHHDNGTHVYDETGMKAIRTYTSTLVAAEDAGFAERSNNAYYANDAGTATKLQTARAITIGNKSNTFDGSGNVSWTLAEIGAEPIAKTVVSKTKSGTTLTLSTDRYQKASLASGDTIALPSVSAYTEIELFVKDCSLTNINLPNNCKWRVDHNLSAGTSFIIRFVYTTQEWLGEIKIFS